MRRGVRRGIALGLAGVLAAACSSDDDPRPWRGAAGGGGQAGSSWGGATGRAGAGGAEANASGAGPTDGGASSDVGGASIGHLGGAAIDAAGAPSVAPPECDRDEAWSEATAVEGISTSGDERLLAMTHDELTLVFTRDEALLVADRADQAATFDAPVAFTLPTGYTHAHGVALRPDGLGLVVVDEVGAALADVTRVERRGGFDGVPSGERFAQLASHIHFTSGRLSSPVLSSSGDTLFYTLLKAGTSRVFRIDGQDGFAAPGAQQDTVTLGGSEDAFKLTQSVSADGRTLFVYDEGLAHGAGLWNTGPDKPFTQARAFPGMEGIFTGAGCLRLYATSTTGASSDVVVSIAD